MYILPPGYLYMCDHVCRLHTKGKNITYCEECWAGYYCPTDKTIEPSPCPKGSYSDIGATECTTCEAGYYCEFNATR